MSASPGPRPQPSFADLARRWYEQSDAADRDREAAAHAVAPPPTVGTLLRRPVDGGASDPLANAEPDLGRLLMPRRTEADREAAEAEVGRLGPTPRRGDAPMAALRAMESAPAKPVPGSAAPPPKRTATRRPRAAAAASPVRPLVSRAETERLRRERAAFDAMVALPDRFGALYALLQTADARERAAEERERAAAARAVEVERQRDRERRRSDRRTAALGVLALIGGHTLWQWAAAAGSWIVDLIT